MRTERVSALKAKLKKLEDAFIDQHTSDRAIYDRQHDRVEEELALPEVDLQEARIESTDVDGVLGFAEHVIGNWRPDQTTTHSAYSQCYSLKYEGRRARRVIG